jgi:hypothetical protein
MAEAKLNAVKSAETQVNGEIRCRVNITTPEGYDWETDYIVVLSPHVSSAGIQVPDTGRLTGLQKDVTEWVLANPDKVKPVTLRDGPVERQDPIALNPDPPAEPVMPPSAPPPITDEIQPPPNTTLPDLPEPPDVTMKPSEPQLKLEPDPEE